MAVTPGSRAERFKHGKDLRRKTPREAHADLKGSMARSAVAILAESDPERVPELVPERYKRMTVNPFAFLRGAAGLFPALARAMAGSPIGGEAQLIVFAIFFEALERVLCV